MKQWLTSGGRFLACLVDGFLFTDQITFVPLFPCNIDFTGQCCQPAKLWVHIGLSLFTPMVWEQLCEVSLFRSAAGFPIIKNSSLGGLTWLVRGNSSCYLGLSFDGLLDWIELNGTLEQIPVSGCDHRPGKSGIDSKDFLFRNVHWTWEMLVLLSFRERMAGFSSKSNMDKGRNFNFIWSNYVHLKIIKGSRSWEVFLFHDVLSTCLALFN